MSSPLRFTSDTLKNMTDTLIDRRGARLIQVDTLRSFALLGILAVNIMIFASPYYASEFVDPNFHSTSDILARFTARLLFDSKFYLLFSFLFGYSFTLLMSSSERAGEPFMPKMIRRLASLWIIGTIHAVLLFFGDILTTYAVMGLILLALRHQPDKRLARFAAGLVIAVALLLAAPGLLLVVTGESTDPIVAMAAARETLEAYRGTPLTVVMQNLEELKLAWIVLGLFQAPSALAMFLIGLIAGRRQLLAETDNHRQMLRRMLWLGLMVGLPGAAIYASSEIFKAGAGWELLGLSVSLLTAPFLSGAYAAGLILWFQTPSGGRMAHILAPAGRMALSNYLLQSLICAFIFYAYGLRLMGTVGPVAAIALALAIYALQLALSHWWMRRFAFGPVEYLLRAVTHWRRPALQA